MSKYSSGREDYVLSGYYCDYNVDNLVVTKILHYDELTYYFHLLGYRLNSPPPSFIENRLNSYRS